MNTTLHRIEALPGAGRYAVTFRGPDSVEQTATVQLDDAVADDIGVDSAVHVAEASLPPGWQRADEAFAVLAGAVRAIDAARRFAPPPLMLVDVDGGWDVGLGNVVLDSDARPRCTAHGQMSPVEETDELWSCAECGAQAALHG